MYPLFESIAIEHGKVLHMDWHQQRYERSYFQYYKDMPRHSLLHEVGIPNNVQDGIFKLRISYNDRDKIVEFSPYFLKNINTLKIVEDNAIDYSLKFTNRNRLNELYGLRGSCDDVLIIKDGYVTDTSYANIIFDDNTKWVTSSTPLLRGTARERLLESGSIIEQDIKKEDIHSFVSFKLINALRHIDDIKSAKIKNII